MAGLGTPFISETIPAIGVVVTPTAGQTIVSIPSSSLPAGYWAIRVLGGASGSAVPPPIMNNVNLMRGGVVYAQLFNMSNFAPAEAIWYMLLNGSQSVSLQAIATESTGVTYNAAIRATRVA